MLTEALPGGLPARRCAVLGSPIAHSLSPVLHRAAYQRLGLDWEYEAIEVTRDDLASFLEARDASWRGLSLTMPLKRTVMSLLDEASETALVANAANTVLLGEDGRRSGHNTDVTGAERALRERGVEHVGTATVAGGGATATSAVLALARLGCHDVSLLVREPARARGVVEAAGRLPDPPTVRVARLDGPLGPGAHADVVVATVPAEAQPSLAEALAGLAPVVFDVLYDPWPTPLVQAAQAAGRTVVGGLDLLVHQATGQVELMTGCERAPLEEMRAAGRAALERRASSST
ncbi:MAG TPA: shikimate dehydrogenase [Nocardioidaceae bacterium]|nr:shikimate dehydrogenase [Nocardioidaceae bacterium]